MARKQTVSGAEKPSSSPHSTKRRFGMLLLKILLVLLAVTILYGIYLDQKIRDRLDGRVWQLPITVYGQIVNLEPGDNYSKDDIVSILKGAQYRQVLKATRPGEFVVSDEAIDIYRRPFQFPDGEEKAFWVRITFAPNKIRQIINLDNGRQFGFFRIDPKLITMMHSPNGEQRLFVPLKDFPDTLIKTLIATEDRRFYEHDGISLVSIARAVIANLGSGRTVQGGSTLTQQLVKNLFLSNERSYIRKLREAYMSLILDFRYSKERILELYLNEVYLGQSHGEEVHGFPLASLYYFGRPVNELSLDQQALLVGMVKGASYYNPWTRPERALERRNVVLKVIENQQIIDGELYELLSRRPLAVLPRGGVITPQPAFMQLVRQEMQQKLADKINDLSGVKIFTTFDPVAQSAAERAVVDNLEQLRKQPVRKDLEAAMVVISRESGEIKAVVGSSQPQYPGFNRALLAKRPIGSLAKPPTYLSALSQPERFQLNTWLDDKPITIKVDRKNSWSPRNFDKKFRGRIMLVDALAHSINVPSVNLGMAVGLDATAKTLKALGVPAAAIKPLPSRFLGALELSPLQVAQMYQPIANEGKRADLSVIRFVMDSDNKVVYQSYPKVEQVVSPQAAYLTLFAMQKVVDYGTAKSLNRNFGQYQLAAKTGTSNDLRDSWVTVIDGKDVAVAWVGLDNHKPMYLTGSTGALRILRDYLTRAVPQELIVKTPPHIAWAEIDEQGRWLCSDLGVRTLPVWTDNPERLCSGTAPAKKAVPEWIQNIFG